MPEQQKEQEEKARKGKKVILPHITSREAEGCSEHSALFLTEKNCYDYSIEGYLRGQRSVREFPEADVSFSKLFSILIMIVLLFIGYQFYKNLKSSTAQKTVETSVEEKPAGSNKDQGLNRVQCKFCDGTGRVPDPVNKTRICFVCRGTGGKQLRKLNPGETICSYCGGMGKILVYHCNGQSYAYVRCSSCKGKGIVRNK
jgi:DnaJ-class molecular chaperone